MPKSMSRESKGSSESMKEDLKDAQQKHITQETGALFELLFHNACVGMGVLTSDGTWIAVNQALCDLLGFEREELVQRPLLSLTYSDDIPATTNLLSKLVSGEVTSYQIEKRYLHKSGRFIWGQLTATRLQLPDGSTALAGQVEDITRRRAAEEALRRSEALFRTVGENAGDLIFLVDFPGFITRYASPTVETLLGYSVSQLVGEQTLELIHPEDHEILFQVVDRMVRQGENGCIVTIRVRNAQNAYHYVEAHSCAVRGSEDDIERLVIVGRVIDDRIAAEKKLRDSEERLQLLLDSTAEGIYGLDLEGNCTFCNSACLKMLGYSSPSEMLGKNVHHLIHGDHQQPPFPERQCHIGSSPVHEAPVHIEDEIVLREDGTSFAAEFWSRPVIEDGVLIGSVVTLVDITARKLVEDELNNAHREAELFINSVPSILIGLDSEGFVKRWNLAAARTFGVTKEQAVGKLLGECGIKWLYQDIDSEIRLLAAKTDPVRWDHLSFDKNGQQRLLGLTLRWIRPFSSKNAELLIVGADITERKKADQELRWKTAFLEAQTNATGDGILVVNDKGQKILQNRRIPEIFKVPQDISERNDDESLLEHILPRVKDPDRFLDKVQQLYAHKDQTSRDEIDLLDGTVLERYSSPVLGRANTYYGRIWTFRDITERKQTEKMLRLLSMAVEQSPVSIVITDPKGNITYVNRRFTETSGYQAEEVLGKRPSILRSEHMAPDDYNHLWETILAGQEWNGIFHNRKKNGELYWESALIKPIADPEGNISHFLELKEDITQKLAMEAQLRQSQKLEAIGQLAAGIAHEINTPMQYIGDNTRFLESAWTSLRELFAVLTPASQLTGESSLSGLLNKIQVACKSADIEYLESEIPLAIQQSLEGIRRVTKIVQAMKEFSHPGSENKVLTDINKAIETTVTVARNEWKYVAELETLLDHDLGLVPCHPGEFNQVILNLITNAAHAIAPTLTGSGQKGKITIRTMKEGDRAAISIQDTGAGIPEAIRSRIFEPFFTTKEPGKGTGQGLALVHSAIVERHGGAIWFDTEVGKGTTFSIQIPLHPEKDLQAK